MFKEKWESDGPRRKEQQRCQADEKAQEAAKCLFIQILHLLMLVEFAFLLLKRPITFRIALTR